MTPSLQDLQDQLELLRKEWREKPLLRSITERRAKAVKRAIELLNEKKNDIFEAAKIFFEP